MLDVMLTICRLLPPPSAVHALEKQRPLFVVCYKAIHNIYTVCTICAVTCLSY